MVGDDLNNASGQFDGAETESDSLSRSQLSPKEIQQRIRSGESVESVAHSAGTTLEYAQRFAAPILDELEHIKEQALATPVITAQQTVNDSADSFGDVITARLQLLFDASPDWSIWKDLFSNRWILQLCFDFEGHQHDARWWYEPKRQYLSPLNSDAESLTTVSNNHPSQGSLSKETTTPKNVTRFDSGAFRPDISQADTMPHNEPIVYGRSADAVITELYQKRKKNSSDEAAQTEDLLSDLQKQRGEPQNSQPYLPLEAYDSIDIPLDDFEEIEPDETVAETEKQSEKPATKSSTSTNRRNRTQVPSWDSTLR